MFFGFTFFCTGAIWCMVVALFASAITDTPSYLLKIQTGFDLFTAVLFVALGVRILLTHF